MTENHPVIEMLKALNDKKELSFEQLELLKKVTNTDPEWLDLAELEYATIDGVKVHEWGGEGEGESTGYVLKIDDEYFKIVGHYSSWDGADYDWAAIYQVEPRQVMRTEYVAI